jgi:hypothetical protein
MQRCNIVFLFINYQIASERYMKPSDRLIFAFQQLYVGEVFIYHCLVCRLIHRKHSEMQYFLSIYRLSDSIERKDKHLGYVNVGISVAVCWCGIHTLLSDVYIDPPEKCRDAISSFHLQITRYLWKKI